MSKGISDALLAELLGDVGKLHDLIKSLPSSLKETISPTLLELSSILKKSQDDLTSLTDEKKLVLQRFADNEKQEIRELIKETIAVELLAMKNALELKEKQLKKSKTPMKVIIISGMVGILCGLVIALFFKNI
jgi:hypothetical protein